MYKLSSLDHVMVGVGCPVAEHFNVTLEASRTVACSVVSVAEMTGGTVLWAKGEEEHDVVLHFMVFSSITYY